MYFVVTSSALPQPYELGQLRPRSQSGRRQAAPAALRSSRTSARYRVSEGADEYTLSLEVPGLGPDDLDVALGEDGHLTVAARDHQLESSIPGPVLAQFALDESIEQDSISCNVNHGLLTVTLPKRAKARARTIPVTAKADRSVAD